MYVFHDRDLIVEKEIDLARHSFVPIVAAYGGKTKMLISFMHDLLDRKREFRTISQSNPVK